MAVHHFHFEIDSATSSILLTQLCCWVPFSRYCQPISRASPQNSSTLSSLEASEYHLPIQSGQDKVFKLNSFWSSTISEVDPLRWYLNHLPVSARPNLPWHLPLTLHPCETEWSSHHWLPLRKGCARNSFQSLEYICHYQCCWKNRANLWLVWQKLKKSRYVGGSFP